MSTAEFLIDTSALVRMLRSPDVLEEWDATVADGLIATCDITEIELLYTARSHADRGHQKKLLRRMFSWVVMPDSAFKRACRLQDALSEKGGTPIGGCGRSFNRCHGRTASPDAVALRPGFVRVAEVTGQPVRWIAEPGTID